MQIVEVQRVPSDRPASAPREACGQAAHHTVPGRKRDGHGVHQGPVRQREVFRRRLKVVCPTGQGNGDGRHGPSTPSGGPTVTGCR